MIQLKSQREIEIMAQGGIARRVVVWVMSG